MSKIIVQYDTVEKTCSVTQDGKNLPNVTYLSVCGSYENKDEMCMSISYGDDEDNGIKMYHTLIASDSKEGQEAIKRGQPLHKDFPEFVVCKSESKIRESITKFLSSMP